jgi:hypothetical protein
LAGGDRPNGDEPGSPGQPSAPPVNLEEPHFTALIEAEKDLQHLRDQVSACRARRDRSPVGRAELEALQRALNRAYDAYVRAGLIFQILHNPHLTVSFDPSELIDKLHDLAQSCEFYVRYLQEHPEYQHELDTDLRAFDKLRTELSETANGPVTSEDVENIETAKAMAERAIDATVKRMSNEQWTPGGVSDDALREYQEAQEAYQAASDALSKMQTSPGYWKYQLDIRKQDTNSCRNVMKSAAEQMDLEKKQNGSVSDSTQVRFRNASAAYADAIAAEHTVRAELDKWRKEYDSMLRTNDELQLRVELARHSRPR